MGTRFIIDDFVNFCSKKVLLLVWNYFYCIGVYENGYFWNIVPTSLTNFKKSSKILSTMKISTPLERHFFFGIVLTCQIFPPTDGRVSPRVITSVCNAPILTHPNQPIGTIIELSFPRQTFPVSVAIGRIRYHFGFGLARILLFNLGLARGRRNKRCKNNMGRNYLLWRSRPLQSALWG